MGQKILILLVTAAALVGCNYNVSKVGSSTGSERPFMGMQEKMISYSRVNELILKPYCLDCHSNGGKVMSNAGDINLETYTELMANLNLVMSEVESGSMPPKNKPQGIAWAAAGSAQLKSYLRKWVALGAQQGDVELPQDQSEPTPPPVEEPKPEVPTPNPEESNPPPVVTEPPPVVTEPPPVVTEPPIIVPPIVIQEIRYADVNTALVDAYCLKCHNNVKQKGDINLEGYENLKKNIQDSVFQIEIGEMPPKGVVIPEEVMKLLNLWVEQGMRE